MTTVAAVQQLLFNANKGYDIMKSVAPQVINSLNETALFVGVN